LIFYILTVKQIINAKFDDLRLSNLENDFRNLHIKSTYRKIQH